MTISEGIPKSLAIIVQRLSQYQANTLKITPINSKDFTPGSVCSIRLPQYKVIDLHSLALMGMFHTNGNGQACSGPGFGAGLIQRISVSSNGVQIGSGASSYNEVIAMLENLTMGEEKRNELSIIENYNIWAKPFLAVVDGALVTTPIPYDYNSGRPWCVNGFHGTILGGTHQRFLDTGVLGTVQLDIQFAQPQVLAAHIEVDATNYGVNDVALYVRTIDFGNGLYWAMIQKKVASSGLVIPFKQYITALSTANGDTDHTIHVGSQCIDAVWTMFKDVGYQAAQGKMTADKQISSYLKSKHLCSIPGTTDMNVKYSLVINNTQLPTFPADFRLAYYLMKQALNGSGRNHLYTNAVKNIEDWRDWKFVFVQSLEHGAELGEVPTLSGLDTLANPVPITVRVQGGAPAHSAMLVVETTSQCVVNEGQIVGYLQ